MRRSRSLALAVVALFAMSVISIVPAGPARIDPAVAAAPEGRLVVFWKGAKAPGLSVAGVARSSSVRGAHRSVVVAEPGQAEAVARQLRRDPRVAAIIPDSRVQALAFPETAPSDPGYATGWQADLGLIGVPAAWRVTRGEGVTVAVLDTGLETTHPDFAGTTIVAPQNVIFGNAAYHTANVADGNDHGTHVSGTIAARTDNGLGIAGIAPAVSLMPVKVLADDGDGFFSDLMEGIDYAVDHGADVINLSLGGALLPEEVAYYQPTFDRASAAGVLVVAASGNTGLTELSYPASFAHVVSVGATDDASDPVLKDRLATFSTRNAMVDVTAPGTWIMSTTLDSTYTAMHGTSMATPHVAGAAALVRAANPDWTVAQVEEALKTTATDLGTAGRDDSFGWGRIRVDLAIVAAPTVAMTNPGTTQVRAPLVVRFDFSEGVQGRATVSVTNDLGQTAWSGLVELSAPTSTLSLPSITSLASGRLYTVAMGAGLHDAEDNPLAARSWTFRARDTVRPTVKRVYPAASATGVGRGVTAKVTFSEAVKGVSRSTVRLVRVSTGAVVSVYWSYNSSTRTVTLNPKSSLRSRASYRIQVRSGITDATGNAIVAKTATFKTRR